MKCPKCGADVRNIDSVHTENNEILRKRICKECDYIFFTMEFECDYDSVFKEAWNRNHRSPKRKERLKNDTNRSNSIHM